MERKQIDELIEKYRRMGTQELKYGEEKCAFFDRIADQIKDSIEEYVDDDFLTEEDIIDSVKEVFDEDDNYYDFDE
jgi:hypothetical protein